MAVRNLGKELRSGAGACTPIVETGVQTADLTRELMERGIVAIVVGGVAMRTYDSPRVTQDLDLAIRTLDVDDIIDLMYDLGYLLVTGVDVEAAHLAADRHAAQRWLAVENPGCLSFVAAPTEVAGGQDDAGGQTARGEGSSAEGRPPDLIALKEARSDRSADDEADIAFLRRLLEDRGASGVGQARLRTSAAGFRR
jgi:hypothetical protein